MIRTGRIAKVALLGVCGLLIGCVSERSGSDEGTVKKHVAEAIHASIGWAGTKDLDLLHRVIANDASFVCVNPENRVVRGFDDFRSAERFWMSDDFHAVGYEISDLKVEISRSGDVAWFYCRLNDWNEWKGQPANWENTRWTGVLEKRKGGWVIVQMHFSFAVE